MSTQRGSFEPGESGPSVLNTVAAPPFPDWPSAREDGAHARRGLPSCGRRRAAGEAALLGAGPWPAATCPSRAWGPHVHIAARLVPAQGVCGARTALETLHFNEIPSTRGCFPARLPCGSASSVLWGVAGGREVAGPRSPSRWLQAPRGGNVSGHECGARWRSKGGAPALGLARSPETTARCHLCLGLAGDGLSAVRIALSLVDTQRPAALTDREVACRPSPRHATPSCLSLL